MGAVQSYGLLSSFRLRLRPNLSAGAGLHSFETHTVDQLYSSHLSNNVTDSRATDSSEGESIFSVIHTTYHRLASLKSLRLYPPKSVANRLSAKPIRNTVVTQAFQRTVTLVPVAAAVLACPAVLLQ